MGGNLGHTENVHSILQPRTESFTRTEKLTTLLGSVAGGHQRCRGRLPEGFEVWDALVVPGRSGVANERCEMRVLKEDGTSDVRSR